jgi:ATP-dependent DNA helicase RecQ
MLFFSKGDCFKHDLFIREMANEDEQRRARKQLSEVARYGELTTCRRAYLMEYFGESWSEKNCNGCDVCLPARPPKKQFMKEGVSPFDQELFDRLRAVRRQLAEEKKVPPYVIFGDKSLQEMARLYPQTSETFGLIFGVGKEKRAQYENDFLGLIRAYANEHQKQDLVERKPVTVRSPLGETVMTSVGLFHQKQSLEAIATQRKLTVGTVITHLESALEQGVALDAGHITLPTDERFQKIEAAFTKTGGGLLAPVKSVLGDAYSYDELRRARFLIRVCKTLVL